MKIRCPTCARDEEVPEGYQWRPFCSRRCKIIDLGNWLDEVYRVSRPVLDADVSEDEDERMAGD